MWALGDIFRSWGALKLSAVKVSHFHLITHGANIAENRSSHTHFTFSLEKLSEYVSSAKLNAIATTNHDMFDFRQFNDIIKKLDCVVYPGIEINLGKGHILLISENENLDEFQINTQKVSEKINDVSIKVLTHHVVSMYRMIQFT